MIKCLVLDELHHDHWETVLHEWASCSDAPSWTNSLSIWCSSWVNGFVLKRVVLDGFPERSEFIPDE